MSGRGKVPGAAALSICKRLRVRGARGPFRETCIELVKSPRNESSTMARCIVRGERDSFDESKIRVRKRTRNESSPKDMCVCVYICDRAFRASKLRLRTTSIVMLIRILIP